LQNKREKRDQNWVLATGTPKYYLQYVSVALYNIDYKNVYKVPAILCSKSYTDIINCTR
jgi:hypothetical protein